MARYLVSAYSGIGEDRKPVGIEIPQNGRSIMQVCSKLVAKGNASKCQMDFGSADGDPEFGVILLQSGLALYITQVSKTDDDEEEGGDDTDTGNGSASASVDAAPTAATGRGKGK